MNTLRERQKLSNVWRLAAESLSLRIEAPYLLKDSAGEGVTCIAYLPDFGGPNGMVIDLLDDPGRNAVSLAAKANKMYYSFINPEVYEKFDAREFQEALTDWGFFGNSKDRPTWMLQ